MAERVLLYGPDGAAIWPNSARLAADDLSNPTAPDVLANMVAWDNDAATWFRVVGGDLSTTESNANKAPATKAALFVHDSGSGLFRPVLSAESTAAGATGDQAITVQQLTRNDGNTFDPFQGNFDATALASQADTQATRTSADLTNYNHRGIRLHLKTSNLTGTTASYTLSVQQKFKGGDYATIWTAAAAVSTAGEFTYTLYPGASGGNETEVDGIPLGRVFRVVLTVASADASNNMDTLVDYVLIL